MSEITDQNKRIEAATISCAATIETRKVRPNEVPVILGSLLASFAEHCNLPIETALEMVTIAAKRLYHPAP